MYAGMLFQSAVICLEDLLSVCLHRGESGAVMCMAANPEMCALPCSKKARTSEWDTTEATPAVGRWDATPGRADEFGATPGRGGGATPGLTPGHSRWDATPTPGRAGTEATPRRNRWDDATPTPGRVG